MDLEQASSGHVDGPTTATIAIPSPSRHSDGEKAGAKSTPSSPSSLHSPTPSRGDDNLIRGTAAPAARPWPPVYRGRSVRSIVAWLESSEISAPSGAAAAETRSRRDCGKDEAQTGAAGPRPATPDGAPSTASNPDLAEPEARSDRLLHRRDPGEVEEY